MSRIQHRWRLPLLGVLTLALLLCCGAQGQTQELSQSRIWNSVLDRVNLKLLFAPVSLADAQGAELSMTTILNLVFVPATETESAYLRTNATGDGGTPGANSVGTTQVIDGSLTANDLATDSVGTLEIIDGSVTATDLGTDSVGTAEIIDGSVTAADLGTDSVGTAEIIDASVTATDLATDSVGTAEIIDASVTTPKLATLAPSPAGAYGSGTEVAQVTINAQGQTTLVANVPITANTANVFTGESLTLPCILHSRIMLVPTVQEYFCTQDEIGQDQETKKCPDDDACWTSVTDQGQLTTTGIRWSATEVQSMRFAAQTFAAVDDCILGTHTLVNVTAGSTGKACQLPNPALEDTVGVFKVYVVDANFLSLTPTEGTLINGAAIPLPAIKGPDAFYDVQRVLVGGVAQWKILSVGTVLLGEPYSLICNARGGNTNTSSSGSGSFFAHDLTCTLPLATLKEGAILHVCPQFTWTLGSAPPTHQWKLKASGVQLFAVTGAVTPTGTSLTRNGMPCITLNVLENPSSASAIWASPEMGAGGMNDGWSQSSTAQPVDINTNAAVPLTIETWWSAAGTGTTSITLKNLLVYGAGLKH